MKIICDNCNSELKTVTTKVEGILERSYEVKDKAISYVEELDFEGQDLLGYFCPYCYSELPEETTDALDDMW